MWAKASELVLELLQNHQTLMKRFQLLLKLPQ